MEKFVSEDAQGVFSIKGVPLVLNRNSDQCNFVKDKAGNFKDAQIITVSHWSGCVVDNVAQLQVTDDYSLSGCKRSTIFKLLRDGEQL